MPSDSVKGNRKPTTCNTPANSFEAALDNALAEKVNTAELVTVTACQPGGPGGAAGYVTVKPLVKQTSAKGETLENCEFFRVPYYRAQAGTAAVVLDPVPGDVGIVVFTKSDSSGVGQGQKEAVPPASYRKFDLANGFYVSSHLNKAPETWIELGQGHDITIHGPATVTIKTQNCTVEAPETHITGNVTIGQNLMVKGNVTWAGVGQGQGGPAKFSGGLANNGGDVVSDGISLEGHTHGGVESGPSATGGPR